MATVNVVTGVVAGEFGLPIIITLVSESGTAEDVSSYDSTKEIILVPEDRTKTVTLTGSFTVDGTDGRVQGTPVSGDIDRPGKWQGQVNLTKTTGTIKAKSFVFEMPVEKSLS